MRNSCLLPNVKTATFDNGCTSQRECTAAVVACAINSVVCVVQTGRNGTNVALQRFSSGIDGRSVKVFGR